MEEEEALTETDEVVTGNEYQGRGVRKSSDGQAFEGKMIKVVRQKNTTVAGNYGTMLFSIQYEDGDEEELELQELLDISILPIETRLAAAARPRAIAWRSRARRARAKASTDRERYM